MIFSNPRKSTRIENWPSGGKRVTATFEVEANKKGERIARTTTGKPKYTTYNKTMCIVDCEDDGKTYLLGLSTHVEMITVFSSDMKHSVKSFFDGDEQYPILKDLLKQSVSSESSVCH